MGIALCLIGTLLLIYAARKSLLFPVITNILVIMMGLYLITLSILRINSEKKFRTRMEAQLDTITRAASPAVAGRTPQKEATTAGPSLPRAAAQAIRSDSARERPRPNRRKCNPNDTDIFNANKWQLIPDYQGITPEDMCMWRIANAITPIDPAVYLAQMGKDSPAVDCYYVATYPPNSDSNGKKKWPGIGLDIKGERFYAPFIKLPNGDLQVNITLPCYANVFQRFKVYRAGQKTVEVEVK